MDDIEKRGGAYFQRILTASAEHGMYGLQLLRALYDQLPKTECQNCGRCCNAISIFSLEFHHIIRDLLTRLPPPKLRSLLKKALSFENRLAEVGSENRLRCVFRDDSTKVCQIHP